MGGRSRSGDDQLINPKFELKDDVGTARGLAILDEQKISLTNNKSGIISNIDVNKRSKHQAKP